MGNEAQDKVVDLRWLARDPLEEINKAKLEALKNGERVFDFSMINPDIEPSRVLLDKYMEASLKKGAHRYAVSRGIYKLRAGFSEKYRNQFNVSLCPESEVCVTFGVKGALAHSLICMGRAGDTVLVGTPVYPVYRSALKVAGLRSASFKISENEEEMLAEISERIEQHSVRFILLNFPNNPTGGVVSKDFYRSLAKIIEGKNIYVFNDFVYGELPLTDERPTSILEVEELRGKAVEVYSLSKAYSVPGWRVGAVLGSKEIVSSLSKIKSHLDYGLPLPIQIASTFALTTQDDLISQTRETYQGRANLLSDGLRQLGWEVKNPSAGCSVWASAPSYLEYEDTFIGALSIFEKTKVFALPGQLFGDSFSNFYRFALVQDEERIGMALEALSKIDGSVEKRWASNV